jgi:hypothetical protein
MHKKYDLRPRQKEVVADNQPQAKKVGPKLSKDKAKEVLDIPKVDEVLEPVKKEKETKELEELVSPFNIERELSKIKILVPLVELAKNPSYHKQIEKMMQGKGSTNPPDTLNVQDESPTIVFGPHIDDKEESVAPFYVTLNIHDKMLHNCMLDSGASHNLMPKVVMEKLGLEITRPYHDLYSFDARKVKCYGMIKDMVVTLGQLPVKRIMMDVVVVDVPTNYGMLLSRTWARKLGGTMQMDMTYATVPVFGGELRRLYQETKFSYVVSDQNNPVNHPIYVVDEDLGCCILSVNEEYNETPMLADPLVSPVEEVDGIWKMFFLMVHTQKKGLGPA